MDRVVVVTGANGGLGAQVTSVFLAMDTRVVGVSRSIREDAFNDTRFTAVPADLTERGQAEEMVRRVMDQFHRIDALVHTTGGFAGGAPVHETGDDTWEAMLNMNLRAAMNVFRAVIPHMRSQGHGRIVAIGSRAGVEPAANIGAYSASKAALVSLVRTVALENRDIGITANVILPGTIDTEANRKAMPKADRSGWVSAERIAELALFLVSDAASQITGAAIPIYGKGL